MNDQRLLEMLRDLDKPMAPEAAFEESLYAALTTKRRRRAASPAMLLAAALLAAAALGTAIFAGSQLLRKDPLVMLPQTTATTIPLRVTDVPDGYTKGSSVPFGFSLVAGGVLIAPNMDEATITRWDAGTLEQLGVDQFGEPGFPPNVQSVFPGTGGVWVTLAVEHAVALLDPRTGEISRRVTIPGYPYDIFEADGDLWIVDVEWSQITRYDLATDTEEAVIREVQKPTDIVVGEGAAWAPAHIGRTQPDEPITAGGYVGRIDLATNEVVATPEVRPRPYYMTTGFGGAWTGAGTGGSVDRVDAVTNEVVTIPIGEDGAFDIEVVGDSVWAVVGPQWPVERLCDPDTSVFVRIDPVARQVVEQVRFPCPGSITPTGNGFWVSGANGDEAVSTFFEAVQ